MRVVHLSWEYPPVVHGGLGRHVDALSRAQVRAGHDVVVVAPADDLTDPAAAPAPSRERWAGVHVERVRLPRLPSGNRGAEQLPDLMGRLQSRMAPTGAGLGADVVHAHDWMVAAAAREVADAAGCPLVLTMHATEHGRHFGRLEEPVHLKVHAAERRAVACADQVVVCSSAMVDELVDHHGAVRDRVHVVPGAVETGRWQVPPDARAAGRARWGGGAEHLVVAAGRLEWEKGFSTLLRAMPSLLRSHPSTTVVLAGQGSYEPVLTALAHELDVRSDLVLPGRLDDPELAALLAAADAVVVPSRYEPFGLVALEAQAAGAPVVVTRTGGLAELVADGHTGRVVDAGDVDHLAAVLAHLLTDREAAQELGRAGRRHAASRTWDDVARRMGRVYAL